mgnify:CR=1 FL=1
MRNFAYNKFEFSDFFNFERAITPCLWNVIKNRQAGYGSPYIIVNGEMGQKALSSKIGLGGGFKNEKFRLF